MNRIARHGKTMFAALFALLLFLPCGLAAKNARTGVFAKYEKSLDDVKNEYTRGVAEDRKERENRERELRLNDRDNNNNNRSRQRKTRVRFDRGESKRRFTELLAKHETIAMELQNVLDEAGLRGYDFPFYAREMTKTFQARGFKEFTSQNEFRTLQEIMNPERIFEFAEYDMARLDKIQFQPGSTPAFNPNAGSHRAFFYFYESLEAYRHFTHGFQRTGRDYASRRDFERRLVHLRISTENLHRLMMKNAPEIALRMNLPEMYSKLEAYYKSTAREKPDFVNKFISESANASTPSERLRAEIRERFKLLYNLAETLRKPEKEKKSARKKSSKDAEDAEEGKPKFNDLLAAFADDPDAESLARALAYFKAKKLLEDTEPAVVRQPLPGKKDDPARTPATPEEVTQWKSSQAAIEAFRKEFAGTDNLIVDGVSDEGAQVLKLTFTPKIAEIFDRTVQKYAGSMSREMINAKAYTAVRAAEQDVANTPTAQELEEIRVRMTDYRKQRTAKETKPAPSAGDWE